MARRMSIPILRTATTCAVLLATALATAGIGASTDAGEAGAAPNAMWALQNPATSPPGTSEGAMAFDAALDQTVLFGGSPGTGTSTWGWNGTTWKVLTTKGPTVRKDMQMVYDATTRSIVLFGGFGSTGQGYSDTWTFDGAWHKRAPVNVPTTVLGYGMAYDAANRTVVMAGGERTSATGKTWVWDGSNWHGNPSVPYPSTASGLTDPTMTYDPVLGKIVLFGGITGVVNQNRTWEWDGSTWTGVATATTPGARRAAASAYDAALGGVVMIDGIGGVVKGTTLLGGAWLFDGSTWTKLRTGATRPSPRAFAQMGLDPSGHVLLFGGLTDAGAARDSWLL